MDVRRLEVLHELRLRGSVTAVAAATRRTPSAVSQQLKALEREVGAVLTERSGRGLVLTAHGEALARAAGDVVEAVARADELWRAYVDSPEGRVELAVFPTGGRMFLPQLLDRVRDVPGLQVVGTDLDSAPEDVTAMASEFDLVVVDAVGPAPAWRDPHLIATHLVDEPLDIALPVGHPLADLEAVTAAQLVDDPWIGAPRGFPFERVLHEIERVTGSPLEVVQRYSDTRIAEALVAAGHGLAVLPRFTSGGEGSGIVLKPLAGIAPVRRIAAVMRRETMVRPSVRAVLADLVAIAAGLS